MNVHIHIENVFVQSSPTAPEEPSGLFPSAGRKTVIKSVSLPHDIAEMGQARAEALGRSFSNYVGLLIEQDAKSGTAR